MRLLKGLGSLALMVFVLAGIPTLLWFLGGNPLPTELPSMDLLTKPTDLGLFLGAITLAGWAAWATLAWAIVVELVAAIRGVTITPPKALAWQHGSARNLVGGVMLLGALGAQIGGTAVAGAAPAGPDAAPGTQYVADRDATKSSTATTDAPIAATNPARFPQPQTVTTERGDTLWDLAETHLGDGHRWTEIRDANPESATGPFLPTGATLTLPATATPAGPGQVTVVEGDCLWDLAATHLGDPYRWTEIRDANPGVVHAQGSLIYIGTHLTIPTGAPQAAAESAPTSTPQVSPEISAPAPEDQDAPPAPDDPAPVTSEPAPSAAPSTSPAAPQATTHEGAPTRSEAGGRHADTTPSSSTSPPTSSSAAPSTSQAPDPAPSSEAAAPVPSTSSAVPETTQEEAPTRSEAGGRHADTAPAPAESEPSETDAAPASAETDPEPTPAESAPAVDLAPAESASPETDPAPTDETDIAQSAEDQAARILSSLGDSGAAPTTTQSQELPPPPPPASAPAETPAPPPSAPDPTAAPTAEPLAEIGSMSVAPQPEAAPGSAEAQQIAEQAAAAAAEYGLGASPNTPARVQTPIAPSAPAASEQQPSAVATDPALASTELNERTTMVTGLSAVALFGVISIVQLYRRRQQHDRRRGEAIALPADEASEILTEANAAVDPLVLADVDLVLRHLDDCTRDREQVPQVVGVTLTEHTVDVAIATDLELPEPWARVDGAWSVAPRHLPDAPHSLVSPWPSLAAVGATAAGDPFLLNLEDVGHLAVSAPNDRDLARHIMQAIAVELAVSPIADGDLHIHLVGLAPDLPAALDNGRLDHWEDIDALLDHLDRTSGQHSQALAADDLATTAHARRAWDSSDYTAPHVVLCAAEITEAQLHRLGELTRAPRFAAAAVTSQPAPVAGGWVLEATDSAAAQLHTGAGGGLAITPAQLTDADLAAVVEVLAAAQRPSRPTPAEETPAEPATEGHEPTEDVQTVDGADGPADVPTSTAPTWAAEEVETTLADTAPMPRLVDPLTDTVDHPTFTLAPPADDTPAASHHAAATEPADHLWLHLLGEPKVTPLSGEKAPESREGRLTELAVLLHLEGELTHTQIDERLWPRDPQEKIADPTERARKKKDRRQQAFSRLRRWMGETAGGEEAFPKVGGRYSDTRYHLHPDVTSDWQRWQQLVPRMACEATTADLVEAMALVRGTPLTRHTARITTYGWADDYRQDMISRVTDAAEELAARQINDGSVADALATAQLGLEVCTAREGLWRMAIISTHGLGGPSSRDQTQDLIDRMLTEMTELEVELEPQTTDLLDLLDQLHTDEGDPLYDISAEAS
ncbi:LysM peptidoglycan-binding domain-containing protein [Dietzia sp. CQ4]|uniref:LysM peptidoglycan-binding domain-containing protein n=1 Tax=Dietzia sp. (strain CQ4) TaxID=370437 RepID=UPI0015FACC0B|nr:LysM peptidoglycan-binding domain-containing protein [Dietzia sp. CQ4]MBB1033573.1 LysM peptidoglycan-binding domain-containing protein [Dietzia sp. CQ4]